jgi:hypothetical protein
MPIHPQYKWFYPIDWPQLSAVIRFERAKGRCERCGRPHGREIQHLGDGRWWDEGTRLAFQLPFDPPSVVIEGNKMTATAENLFIDYWERVH